MTPGPLAERTFLSIGEVLDLLKAEFPDVTISKIRFLESQGLVDPERTPSGYRKFYSEDVERLRWILRQQRENFLPLKVIKGRLLSGLEPEPAPDPETPAPAAAAPAPPAPAAEPVVEPAVPVVERAGPLGNPSLTDTTFTAEELSRASGLDAQDLADLEKFGLLTPRAVAGQPYYDEQGLVIARLAASFARHGIAARHLRMYKMAADREASFYEQVVAPLVKQRNPQARRQAVENLTELARLGEGLRGALLRTALREHTDGG